MAKLVFPTLLQTAYMGDISFLRSRLQFIASNAQKSPGMVPDIAACLLVLTRFLAITVPAAGVPAQPTSLVAVPGTTGIVYLTFAGGANSTSYEYAVSTDAGATFGAAVAVPANRVLTGIAAGSKIFKVRGVNTDPVTPQGVYSANSGAITVL